MIPDGWQYCQLRDLATVERGKFSARPRNDPKYYGGDIPFVQTGDVARSNGKLTDFSQTLNELGLAVSKLFPSGTILITIAANIGETTICQFPVACPDSLVGIEVNENISEIWLCHALEMKKDYLEQRATQNAQKNINLEILRPLEIGTPPDCEQKAIASILTTWDRAIEKTEALIETKERRKAGLMQRLLMGKVRFGEFGPVADDTPPTDWDTCRLEDICKRVTRKNPDGITHVLTASGEHGLVDQRDYFNRSVAGESLANYYLLKKGEFAYNRSSMNGYPYGAIKRLDRYEAGLLSTLYLCFRITSEKVDSDYLRHFFDSPILNKELRGIVQVGARAHGLLNVSTGDFMRLRVCIPSLKEQKRIAKCLDAATSEIQEHRNQLTALKEQKKGLMQQLLTGKVRVKAKE
jgi:type I restriction enzyme S subunit